MNVISKYKILKNERLVIEFHKNDMTFENAIKTKLKIINSHDFCPEFSFLIDVREAKFRVTKESTKIYGNFVSENLILKGVMKIAILTESSEHVANATILGFNPRFVSSKYQIFSSLEASIRWLNIDINKLDTIYSELKRMSND